MIMVTFNDADGYDNFIFKIADAEKCIQHDVKHKRTAESTVTSSGNGTKELRMMGLYH